MTREETIAAALFAAWDEVDIRHGASMVERGRDAEHAGDCTKQPWTCARCLFDEKVKEAAMLEKHLKSCGLQIVEIFDN